MKEFRYQISRRPVELSEDLLVNKLLTALVEVIPHHFLQRQEPNSTKTTASKFISRHKGKTKYYKCFIWFLDIDMTNLCTVPCWSFCRRIVVVTSGVEKLNNTLGLKGIENIMKEKCSFWAFKKMKILFVIVIKFFLLWTVHE